MNIAAFIFARGGSQGIPKKNLKLLNNKPLIAHSIQLAQSVGAISEIFVSTDSDEIREVAEHYGALVIKRPPELATSDSPEWLSWQHALNFLAAKNQEPDIFISLPATSPLRSKQDIEKCLSQLDENTDIVVTMTESKRSPWFNMVTKKEDGYLKVILSEDRAISRRQDTPVSYDLTTVAYVTRPKYIRSAKHIFDGRVKGVEIPQERAVDIDNEVDFLLAEALMRNRV